MLMRTRIVCQKQAVGETGPEGDPHIVAFSRVLDGLVAFTDPIIHRHPEYTEQERDPDDGRLTRVCPVCFVLVVCQQTAHEDPLAQVQLTCSLNVG